jgi:hypothetical protein
LSELELGQAEVLLSYGSPCSIERAGCDGR